MKRLLLLLLFLALGIAFFARENTAQKRFCKRETYLEHISPASLRAKIAAPLPDWMSAQIAEDLAPYQAIPLSHLDATFNTICRSDNTGYIVRYRILDNALYRYYPEGAPISFKDNTTEKALKTLTQCVQVPNLDIILSYYDGALPAHSFYFTEDPALQAPILISAKLKSSPHFVLIPDWRSLGKWWIFDIHSIKKHSVSHPWETKRPFALWRGGLTKDLRFTLCQLSLQYPEHLDAKLNGSYIEDVQTRIQCEREGLIGSRVSWDDFLSCKYLPYVDGVMCASPALQWRLLSHSVTFKPDSDEIQWFYRALKPYVHYIPTKSDLSDLISQLNWAQENDALCRQIGDQAAQFAHQNLLYEEVLLYFNAVLSHYAKLQQASRAELMQSTRSDPHWVNIQHRRAIRDRTTSLCPTPF